MKKYLLLLALFFAAHLHSDDTVRLVVIDSWQEIDSAASQKILVKGFMKGYENVPLKMLNPNFSSIGDVRRFYEAYFLEELEHFKNGELIWVEAYVDDVLAGWATFQLEAKEPGAAYMNLLVVHPKYQKMGVGKALTMSICSDMLYPSIKAINLLIRKVNEAGYKFYYKLGFQDHDYTRDNFVDPALLTGLRYSKE